jgi:hypothetical protein
MPERDMSEAWNDYLRVCQLHKNSPTYEAAEAAAWDTLISEAWDDYRRTADERKETILSRTY